MKRSGLCILLAGIFMTLFFASAVLAAYEFYLIQLTSKGPIDWTLAAKEISSVKGVERTQIDQEKGVVTVTCSSQCNDSILNGVKNKLKAKGIEQKLVGKPGVSGEAGRIKTIKGDSSGKFDKVDKTSPALKYDTEGKIFPKVENQGKILPQNK